MKLIKVLTRQTSRAKRRPVEERIIRPAEIPSDHRPYTQHDKIDFPFPTGMSAIWKNASYPFNPESRHNIRKFLLDTWGPGYYRVYKWGGHPPTREYYQGWTV